MRSNDHRNNGYQRPNNYKKNICQDQTIIETTISTPRSNDHCNNCYQRSKTKRYKKKNLPRSNDHQNNCYQWLNSHRKNIHRHQMIIGTTMFIRDQTIIRIIAIKDQMIIRKKLYIIIVRDQTSSK